MAVSIEILENKLQQFFGANANWQLKDLVGDEDHWELTISSTMFAGKNRVEQHKLVNLAFKDILGTTLHALKVIIKI